jgi:hypothetical protein
LQVCYCEDSVPDSTSFGRHQYQSSVVGKQPVLAHPPV